VRALEDVTLTIDRVAAREDAALVREGWARWWSFLIFHVFYLKLNLKTIRLNFLLKSNAVGLRSPQTDVVLGWAVGQSETRPAACANNNNINKTTGLLDFSYHGLFVPCVDHSYYGPFVP